MKHILALFLLTLASSASQAFPTYATGGFRGADLMTADEVKTHIGRLLGMQTMSECTTYMDEHEAVLQQRAKEHQVTLPAKGGDPCQVMRFMGRIR